MNHSEPETDALASGLTRSQIEALLADAEPRCLDGGGRRALEWRPALGLVAVVAGIMAWRLCNRLWGHCPGHRHALRDLTIPHRLIGGLMGDHDGPLR